MPARGPWVQTYTQRKSYPLDLRPEDVDVRDVAHHLATMNRWCGAAYMPISIAQHSVLVAEYIEREITRLGGDAQAAREGKFAGLIHDAMEAYLPDLPSPLKEDHRLAFYKEMDEAGSRVIHEAWGAAWPPPEIVKRADRVVGISEARDLLIRGPHPDWPAHLRPEACETLPFKIAPVDWRQAEADFLAVWYAVQREREIHASH